MLFAKVHRRETDLLKNGIAAMIAAILNENPLTIFAKIEEIGDNNKRKVFENIRIGCLVLRGIGLGCALEV